MCPLLVMGRHVEYRWIHVRKKAGEIIFIPSLAVGALFIYPLWMGQADRSKGSRGRAIRFSLDWMQWIFNVRQGNCFDAVDDLLIYAFSFRIIGKLLPSECMAPIEGHASERFRCGRG